MAGQARPSKCPEGKAGFVGKRSEDKAGLSMFVRSLPHFAELLEEELRGGPGGGWILTGGQQPRVHDMNRPIGLLRKYRAESQHLILAKERHHLGEADGFFFAVGEASHFLAQNERLAIGRLHVTQSTSGVAN